MILIDVREPAEQAAGSLEGARPIPLGTLPEAAAGWPRENPVVLVCRTGNRARRGAQTLREMGFADVRVLDGGMEACRRLESNGWTIERQVRFAAGSIVTASCALGFLADPNYFWGAAAIGGGLTFAALSNTCAMGNLLARMPWNKRA